MNEHTLEWNDPTGQLSDDVVGEYIADHEAERAVRALLSGGDQSPRVTIKALSAEFPGVLFTLHGAGEEADDLWVAYFRDGKGYSVGAVITYPEFDEARLEEATS